MGRSITRAESKPSIMKMLDASIGTVNVRGLDHLNEVGARFDGSENPVISYQKDDYGWFIWVAGPDLGEEELTSRDQEMRGYGYTGDFLALIHHARVLECGWIMLDQDGSSVPGLGPGNPIEAAG